MTRERPEENIRPEVRPSERNDTARPDVTNGAPRMTPPNSTGRRQGIARELLVIAEHVVRAQCGSCVAVRAWTGKLQLATEKKRAEQRFQGSGTSNVIGCRREPMAKSTADVSASGDHARRLTRGSSPRMRRRAGVAAARVAPKLNERATGVDGRQSPAAPSNRDAPALGGRACSRASGEMGRCSASRKKKSIRPSRGRQPGGWECDDCVKARRRGSRRAVIRRYSFAAVSGPAHMAPATAAALAGIADARLNTTAAALGVGRTEWQDGAHATRATVGFSARSCSRSRAGWWMSHAPIVRVSLKCNARGGDEKDRGAR